MLADLPSYQVKGGKHQQIQHITDPLIVGLVLFGVGSYREVLNMDFEDAIYTYAIHYINRINENLAIENAQNKNK